ncbi:MAG: ABC transporter ATP-binding protein [Chloroflexi bacterium]|nr:ABC transporter ATP-binding protein [Chloroflexota bacterium]
MIELNQVVKQYGTLVVLNSVSLSVSPGEWVSIMGPSGSGKTTLLNLIAGLDTPTSGQIWVKDTEVSAIGHEARARFRRETIGIVFQQFHLIPYLTAVENVMLAQYLHSLPDRDEAMAALKLVGLDERANHLASRLSGGEQQRVAIARAIINDPPLLLADEPTGNLDAENEQIVLDIFRRLHDEGKTIVIVTHNAEVTELGDRTIRIHHGKTSEVGVVTEKV